MAHCRIATSLLGKLQPLPSNDRGVPLESPAQQICLFFKLPEVFHARHLPAPFPGTDGSPHEHGEGYVRRDVIVDPQNPRLRPWHAYACLVQPFQDKIQVPQLLLLFGPIADTGSVTHQLPVVFLGALVTKQETVGIQGRILERHATQVLKPLESTIIQLAGEFHVMLVIENGGSLHELSHALKWLRRLISSRAVFCRT